MQASKPRQAGTSRRKRIAAAKLSELAAEARAGWDATTLERLIVKGLTRYYHGIDNEARRAGTALANAPAAFIRHNTFIEPRHLDERGGECHVWADHESAAPRVLGLFDRLNEKLKQADQQGEVYIVGGAMMALGHDAKRVTEDVDLHMSTRTSEGRLDRDTGPTR